MNNEKIIPLLKTILKIELFFSLLLNLNIWVLNQPEKNKIMPNNMLVLDPSITPSTNASNNGIIRYIFAEFETFFNPKRIPPNKFAGNIKYRL